MAESEPVADLVAAVSDALRGDTGALNTVIADARVRAEARAVDSLKARPLGNRSAAPLPAATPRPIPQPQPDRAFQITLANGRRVRTTIAPAVARRRDLIRVARISAENDRRAFRAIGRHRRAIHDLRRSQRELSENLKRLQNQADRVVVGLVHGVAGLERQVRSVAHATPVAAALSTTVPGSRPVGQLRSQKRLLDAQRQQLRQMRAVKTLAFRAQVQNVTNVVNSVQTAAYGDRGSFFSTNNMLLAGNQLFWSFFEPVLKRAGVLDAASSTVMAVLAPLGTLLTGQVLLADRQHVRFISGVATIDTASPVHVESLRDRVAEGFWPGFQQRRDIVVTVTVLDPGFGIRDVLAEVDQGILRIRLLGRLFSAVGFSQRIRVAWMVDTGAGVG